MKLVIMFALIAVVMGTQKANADAEITVSCAATFCVVGIYTFDEGAQAYSVRKSDLGDYISSLREKYGNLTDQFGNPFDSAGGDGFMIEDPNNMCRFECEDQQFDDGSKSNGLRNGAVNF